MLLTERLAALIADAGYNSREPVIAAVHRQGFPPVFVTQGEIRSGESLSPAVLTYAASLSKQITAACAALLVREGVLDMEAPMGAGCLSCPLGQRPCGCGTSCTTPGPCPTMRSTPSWEMPTGPRRRCCPRSRRPPSWQASPVPPTPILARDTYVWQPSWNEQPASRCQASPASGSSFHSACGGLSTGLALPPLQRARSRWPRFILHRCLWVMGESGRRPATCCGGVRRLTPTSWASLN